MSTAEKLYEKLKNVESGTSGPYSLERCRQMAPRVDEIKRLKQEKNAVILAHSYVHPEIIYGVSDFVGDSYQLSKDAKATTADVIVFVAVRFMAETAKVLNPDKEVRIPSRLSGCSLADSITAEDVRRLKAEHPGFTFVCYINTSAEVKAECDVCVTSSNVYDIVQRIPSDQIYFLPDKLMGENVQDEMKRRGVAKDIRLYDGTCYVHAEYDAERVRRLQAQHPGLKVLSHPECTRDIIEQSDFVASTSGLMDYMQADQTGSAYLLLTECGLAGRAQVDMPGKTFIGPCFECKYMKSNSLDDVRRVLVHPEPEDIIEISPDVRAGALRCIDNMFTYAEMVRD
ncbi:MAG: quinolinate synthase NadA [Kiritimatiellae bacterium]|jgi:quinolinate synthase|nr:quinolinate synthase NadA [Kiritimatiellia bacterium]MDD4342668.1 quinolinate synthase NadA [Kiritimatiellia bacterium]MDY0149397.1 quinolinate synthase NadA [Kiritimatiellia bacterium]